MTDDRYSFPRSFEEQPSPVSQEERQRVRDAFEDMVDDTMMQYFPLVRSSSAERDGNVTKKNDLELVSVDPQEQVVDVTITHIEGEVLRSSIVYLRWLTGVRYGDAAAYFVDVHTGDVIRRDISNSERILITKSTEQILGKSLEHVTEQAVVTDAVQRLNQEGAEGRQLERTLGLNDQPIAMDEMNWLTGIVDSAYPRP
jgi:hypothetical protein